MTIWSMLFEDIQEDFLDQMVSIFLTYIRNENTIQNESPQEKRALKMRATRAACKFTMHFIKS